MPEKPLARAAIRASLPAVSRKFPIVVACSAGLGFVLGVVSCGPTCPYGQQSCGSSNPSAGAASTAGAAGAAGAGSSDIDPTTCDQLDALRACMDAFCASASNPFCTCYTRKYDISTSCTCSKFNATAFCQQAAANGIKASDYNCASASSAVATVCVGVR